INAQAGGTIYADVVAQRPGTIVHSAGRGGQEHPVQFAMDSRLRQIMGLDTMITNTYHIQAVVDVGEGLRAVRSSTTQKTTADPTIATFMRRFVSSNP
ncbi:MAG: gamma-glutamyl-gamma-aminobutyrate hydrolase family protein, partial [Actinobacteria bacterium]|nr:gamma-glutamyl-gamma-aminobutyrate hydrolase family protein [Actinomycetota bacterium]